MAVVLKGHSSFFMHGKEQVQKDFILQRMYEKLVLILEKAVSFLLPVKQSNYHNAEKG